MRWGDLRPALLLPSSSHWMWRFGRPCAACEAVNAAVARTRLSDGFAVEVLFAAGWTVSGLSALSRSKGRRWKDHTKVRSNWCNYFPGDCPVDQRAIHCRGHLAKDREPHQSIRAKANPLITEKLNAPRHQKPAAWILAWATNERPKVNAIAQRCIFIIARNNILGRWHGSILQSWRPAATASGEGLLVLIGFFFIRPV